MVSRYNSSFRLSEKIAVLRLDGDWYDSTRIPLENFFDNISIEA